ncbi:hypothetical protein GH733_016607 [Mirounga leonina]|nr:hypothetical protein GH733_016607 [Mirounga leonina]
MKRGQGLEGRSQFLVAVGQFRQLAACYTSHGTPSALAFMLLPSPPPAFLAPGPPWLLEVLLPEPQGKHRRADQLHMQWEDKVIPKAELAQAEELLEQQLELYQALLEGQEGAWEAQALVLKIQKLKEQMRRHRESLGDA